MRALFYNLIQDAVSVSMTNANLNYPVESCYSSLLEEYVKATDSSSVVTVLFDEDKTIDTIAFGYHNLNNISFVFKNASASVLATESVSLPLLNDIVYITELTTVRSIEITVTSADSEVMFGNISCGVYTELPNFAKPQITYVDTGTYDTTDGGQVLSYKGTLLESYTIQLQRITKAEALAIRSAYSEIGKGITFWLDRLVEDDTALPTFGCIVDDIVLYENNELVDLMMNFMEAR